MKQKRRFITALLMHFELMSFWSLLLYALGMLGLELMITYVEVPTGKRCAVTRNLLDPCIRSPVWQ